MTILYSGIIKVYNPSEATKILGMKTVRLRNYSLLLESNCYDIACNCKRSRY